MDGRRLVHRQNELAWRCKLWDSHLVFLKFRLEDAGNRWRDIYRNISFLCQ